MVSQTMPFTANDVAAVILAGHHVSADVHADDRITTGPATFHFACGATAATGTRDSLATRSTRSFMAGPLALMAAANS